MANHIFSWFGGNKKKSKSSSFKPGFGRYRLLRHELLEDRRMLATLTVNVNGDGNIVDNGNLTLREAIAYVNGTAPGPLDFAQIDETQDQLGVNDTIVFASSLNGGMILLTQNELQIFQSVTIDASMLSGGITIQAYDPTPTQNNFDGARALHISSSYYSSGALDVTLQDLTITGGGSPVPAKEFMAVFALAT